MSAAHASMKNLVAGRNSEVCIVKLRRLIKIIRAARFGPAMLCPRGSTLASRRRLLWQTNRLRAGEHTGLLTFRGDSREPHLIHGLAIMSKGRYA